MVVKKQSFGQYMAHHTIDLEFFLSQQEKLLDAKLKPIEEKLNRFEEALFGNGKPGLIKRMDDAENTQKSILAKFAMFTGFFSLVGVAVFETIKEFVKSRLNL